MCFYVTLYEPSLVFSSDSKLQSMACVNKSVWKMKPRMVSFFSKKKENHLDQKSCQIVRMMWSDASTRDGVTRLVLDMHRYDAKKRIFHGKNHRESKPQKCWEYISSYQPTGTPSTTVQCEFRNCDTINWNWLYISEWYL